MKLGKCLERDNRGYITVEAAYIFPIIVFGLLAVIWICFYLYNQIKLGADAELVLSETGRYIAEAGYCDEKEICAGVNLSEKLNGYMMGDLYSAELVADGNTLLLTAKIQMRPVKGGLMSVLAERFGSISGEWTATVYDRTGFMRKWQLVFGLLSDRE